MILRNAAALLGPGLEYAPRAGVRVEGDGTFGRAGPGVRPRRGEESADCEGLLLVPGLVNAHTHVGDSVAKDAALGGPMERRTRPVVGAKSRVLGRTGGGHLASFMAASCRSMLARGVTTFADFREGGLAGIALLRRALAGTPIRAVVLGRVEHYHGARAVRAGRPLPPGREAELGAVLAACDGLGISGANENSDAVLRRYSRAGGLRAIHAAETARSAAASLRTTGAGEAARALLMRPHALVHMTHATPAEMRAAARAGAGIVVCPRANAVMGGGTPRADLMAAAGCTVALGTDNVMVNPPDMFREMDYLWKATAAAAGRPGRLGPRDVLKMATSNAGRILRRPVGAIAPGMAADLVALDARSLDMYPACDPWAAVVHRASERSVRAVVVGGKVAHGRI